MRRKAPRPPLPDDPWETLRAYRRGDIELLRQVAVDASKTGVQRRLAIRKLGDLGDEGALSLARPHLDSDDSYYRNTAVATLSALARPETLPDLLRAARDDSDDYVRWQAHAGLARIGGPQALAALAEALREPRWWGRRSAALALEEHGGEEARQLMLAAARREGLRPYRQWWMRRRARGALRSSPPY